MLRSFLVFVLLSSLSCATSKDVAEHEKDRGPRGLQLAWPAAESLPAYEGFADPFLHASGERVRSERDWTERRAEIESMLSWYEYGRVPEAPGNVVAQETSSREVLDGAAVERRVTLRFGPDHSLSLRVGVVTPKGEGPFPVVLKNDSALGACPILEEMIRAGYIVVDYLRADLDPDKRDVVGPAQRAYPDHDWATIAVWAWGGMRVVDWLVTLEEVDADRIAVTGHSRGGKTALLHGALDTRVAATNPNGSGAGGAGSYRFSGKRAESLEAITQERRFGYWFSPRLRDFAGREDRLPFDQHFVMALVAPRALLVTDAEGDHWANPPGTQEVWRVSREIYRFFGEHERLALHFRLGEHDQNAEDWRALLDFLEREFRGKEPARLRRFNRLPFPDAAKPLRWQAPTRENAASESEGA